MPQSPNFLYGKGPSGAVPLAVDANGVLKSSPSSAKNITTNVTTQVKNAAGTVKSISINTGGNASTLTLWDGPANTGTKLGTFATTAQGVLAGLDIGFAASLTAVTAGTGAADITIAYK